MKKRFVLLLLILLSFPAWAEERIKIGFVDIQRAINESQAGKKAKEQFQTQVKKAESDLLKEKQEVERLKSEVDKKGPLLKDEERRNLEMDLQKRYLGYQRSMQDYQQELRQREGEMTADILRDLEKIVSELGKAEKFTFILERSQVLYSDHAVDITNRVVEIYNGRGAGKPTKSK